MRVLHRWDRGRFVFNLEGSRAEVAGQYPRDLQKATRHAVIATGSQAFSLCPTPKVLLVAGYNRA